MRAVHAATDIFPDHSILLTLWAALIKLSPSVGLLGGVVLLRSVELEASVEEIESSPVVAELIDRLTRRQQPAAAAPLLDEDDDDDSASGDGGASIEAVPGVAAEGQPVVLGLLAHNPAAELFVRFLAETTAWTAVRVHGVKPKGTRSGAPLDYSRYLRLRKQGSQYGGFAYVQPIDGTVLLRLNMASDAELAALAPAARRLHAGHREYRVNIRIEDETTLQQALTLARRAYDLT